MVKEDCKKDEPLDRVYSDTLAGLFTPSRNIGGIWTGYLFWVKSREKLDIKLN